MNQCKGVSRDWILYEVPSIEGDEGHSSNRDEERETCYPGGVSRVWDEDVQDREGVGGAYRTWLG